MSNSSPEPLRVGLIGFGTAGRLVHAALLATTPGLALSTIVTSALRRALLDAPLNGKSIPLDIGYSATIPESIRKAVIARDKGCAWPGCNRRPAACDVHHVKHKKHGGKTSTTDCVLLCQYHHDICIHRNGWGIELLPDGSVRVTSPDRQSVLRSHGPPPAGQPSG